MPARKKSRIPDDKVEQYEELVATIPEVQRKGADNPYTSLNGNMFSLLQSPDGRLALRLSEKHREAFLKKYQTTLFEAYGIIKKEYVTVPDSLLKKTNELKKYFAQSYEYARTLKPKPTKKKP
jgi:TfoX/Sxy family transcriptional regulator of competence genes